MRIGEQWPEVLNLVVPDPRPVIPGEPEEVWVTVTPDRLYRATLERLLVRLQNPYPPAPGDALRQIYARAKLLEPQVWHHLRVEDVNVLDPMTRVVRAEALDILRLWFTEMLSRAMDIGPDRRLGLHIGPKDSRYKQ